MTKIESKSVTINKNAQWVFDYLTDLNHFEELLPQEKISGWEASTHSCSFKIQGSAHIGLELDTHKTEAPHFILIKSSPKTPFPFTLAITLNQQGGQTTVSQLCEAEINAFLKMMVEKPLKNLFDYIADQLIAVSQEN